MKACTVCEEVKPLTEFFKKSGTKDGHCSACKNCQTDKKKMERRMKNSKLRQDKPEVIEWTLKNCDLSTEERLRLEQRLLELRPPVKKSEAAPQPTHKTCTSCGQSKLLADFHPNYWKKKQGGYQNRCKQCVTRSRRPEDYQYVNGNTGMSRDVQLFERENFFAQLIKAATGMDPRLEWIAKSQENIRTKRDKQDVEH